MTPEEKEVWLAKLRKAAESRDRAKATLSQRLAETRALIRDANDAGVPMTEVALAANVARSRAHRLYAKAPRRPST